jgi:hypothetical protein
MEKPGFGEFQLFSACIGGDGAMPTTKWRGGGIHILMQVAYIEHYANLLFEYTPKSTPIFHYLGVGTRSASGPFGHLS